MAIPYKMVEKVNPRDLTQPKKAYALAVHNKHFKLAQLSKEVSARSTTASEGDVYSAVIGLRDLIKEHLDRGDKVTLAGIGTFQVNISSEGAESADKFVPSLIRGNKLSFQPDSEMKQFLNGLRYEKYNP
jgi:predicted histone-like DNA-binding protein